MLNGWNVPRATEAENQELMLAIRVPETSKIQITKIGTKYIYAKWVCGGEWTEDKFNKQKLLAIIKNTKTVQTVNRRELLKARY